MELRAPPWKAHASDSARVASLAERRAQEAALAAELERQRRWLAGLSKWLAGLADGLLVDRA